MLQEDLYTLHSQRALAAMPRFQGKAEVRQ